MFEFIDLAGQYAIFAQRQRTRRALGQYAGQTGGVLGVKLQFETVSGGQQVRFNRPAIPFFVRQATNGQAYGFVQDVTWRRHVAPHRLECCAGFLGRDSGGSARQRGCGRRTSGGPKGAGLPEFQPHVPALAGFAR